MKTKILLHFFLLITSICYSQIQVLDHTPPNADNLKQAAIKINANDAYLDTMGVQRLDSLIDAGVGSSVTAGSGLTLSGNTFELGGIQSGVNTVNTNISLNSNSGSDFTMTDNAGNGGLFLSNSYAGISWVNDILQIDNTGIKLTAPTAFNVTGNGTDKYIKLDGTSFSVNYGELFVTNTAEVIANESQAALRMYDPSFIDNSVKVTSSSIDMVANNGNNTISAPNGYTVILYLPTVSPCGSAPSGTLWNDAGTLKICP